MNSTISKDVIAKLLLIDIYAYINMSCNAFFFLLKDKNKKNKKNKIYILKRNATTSYFGSWMKYLSRRTNDRTRYIRKVVGKRYPHDARRTQRTSQGQYWLDYTCNMKLLSIIVILSCSYLCLSGTPAEWKSRTIYQVSATFRFWYY